MKTFYSKRIIKLLLYDKQRGRCNACREAFAISNLEVDHIIPRAGGGSDIPSNFQLLCKPCNLKKRAHIKSGSQYNLFDSPKEKPKTTPRQIPESTELSQTRNALKKRAQRTRARERGVCVVCISTPARAGFSTCEPCNEDAKARMKLRREAIKNAK